VRFGPGGRHTKTALFARFVLKRGAGQARSLKRKPRARTAARILLMFR
jgi:hypothetical protein